ncbi:MAG: hypothetical protein AB8B72_13950 [Crocinitomicaceae bacterium]
MKNLHIINKWSFGITAVLFLLVYTFMFGLIAMFFLGIIQLLLALTITINWIHLTDKNKNKILLYWLFCCSWAIISYLAYDNFNGYTGPLFFTVLPMSIAGFFVYITYKISKQSQQELTNINTETL